jgi:hypothetical protein
VISTSNGNGKLPLIHKSFLRIKKQPQNSQAPAPRRREKLKDYRLAKSRKQPLRIKISRDQGWG